MASSMRQRAPVASKQEENGINHDDRDDKYHSKSSRLMKDYVWLILVALHVAVYLFIDYRSHTFPEPKTVANHNSGDFVEERARNYLLDFAALGDGTRPTGSHENEVLAVEYLLGEINKIKSSSKPVHQVDVDLQTTSGTFTLKFLGEFSSYYENVNNILVKLSPKGGARDSLLVNCHYDTVMDSPGSSDDTVSCCVMLEVLYVLSQSGTPLTHNVIFLFNGAEENILQASHGFITQHAWAKEIRAFINLEGAGAGGREIVFQTGPENPWLIRTYAAVARHPFASIIGQEVFEAGVIPSDTDFRIFRDYGKIPGLDIAYMHNGYVYHTKYDNPSMIPPGCIQRGGDNLLSMVKAFASSPLLAEPGEEKHGSMVFYDVVGMFMVLYPARIGYILNNAVVLLVLVSIARKVFGRSGNDSAALSGVTYMKQLAGAWILLICSWLVTLLSVFGLAYFLEVINHPESWYTNRWLLIGLFVAPAMCVQIAFHTVLRNTIYKTQGDMWKIQQLYFDAHMSLLAVFLGFLTHKGVGSACVLLLFVLFPFIIRDRLPSVMKISFKENHALFTILHIVSISIPNVLFLYMTYAVLEMFVPLMGRVGTVVIPDLFIGAIVGVAVVMCMGYQVGIVYVTKSTRRFMLLLLAVTLVTYILAIFTPVGFPYSADPVHPRKQRYVFHHLDRKFHDISGRVTKSDSGLLIIPLDHFSITPVHPHLPELKDAKLGDCSGPACGWPRYSASSLYMKKVYLLPAPPLQVSVRPKIEKLERQQLEGGIERFTFHISGPSHINVYLTPKPGVTFEKWSVGNGVPHATLKSADLDFDTYFVYYAYGTKPSSPWKFWIECKVSDGVKKTEGIIQMALGGHYTFGKDRHTPEQTSLVKRMPDWTIPLAWTATYEAWVF